MKDLNQLAKIKVIGVGGGGCNAVNRMVEENVQGVEFYVANTDSQVLKLSAAENKIMLGKEISKGLGAGADPEIGKKAAIESEKEIREALSDADLIFLAAGMGGGTGTGAAPEIARMAKETGALVISIVTKPFKFEGNRRLSYAMKGIDELKKYVDSVIIISNDRLLEIIGSMPIKDSFREADNILKQGVQTITDLIAVPSLINLDFADIRTVMKGKGTALFGIGLGSGPDKVIEASNKAITSALLETSIYGAKDVIVNVTGGKTMNLNDAYDVVDIIQQAIGSDPNVIFGIAVNEHLDDDIVVTVIATGFGDENDTLQTSLKQTGQVYEAQPQKNVQPKQDEAQPFETAYQARTSFMSENKPEINNGTKFVGQEPGADVDKIKEKMMKIKSEDEIDNNISSQSKNNSNNSNTTESITSNPTDDDDDFPTFLESKW